MEKRSLVEPHFWMNYPFNTLNAKWFYVEALVTIVFTWSEQQVWPYVQGEDDHLAKGWCHRTHGPPPPDKPSYPAPETCLKQKNYLKSYPPFWICPKSLSAYRERTKRQCGYYYRYPPADPNRLWEEAAVCVSLFPRSAEWTGAQTLWSWSPGWSDSPSPQSSGSVPGGGNK